MTNPPFWQPALERAQLWRTGLGLALVFAIWFAVSIAVLVFVAHLLGLSIGQVAQGRSWPAAAAFFTGFAGFHIGLALVLPILHRRPYRSLFGPSGRLNRRQLELGAGVTVAIAALLYAVMGLEHLVLPAGVSPPVVQAKPVMVWVVGLIPALALIAMQTFAEEAVFRGYLLQQLGARFHSFLIWGFAPALLFGLLHFDPGTYGVVNASAYVLSATLMGTFAALITARTGNLAAAAGLHFGNNAVLTVIGLKGSLDGFSLFVVDLDLKSGYATYSILSQALVMTLAFALWWRWMARHRPIAISAPSS